MATFRCFAHTVPAMSAASRRYGFPNSPFDGSPGSMLVNSFDGSPGNAPEATATSCAPLPSPTVPHAGHAMRPLSATMRGMRLVSRSVALPTTPW